MCPSIGKCIAEKEKIFIFGTGWIAQNLYDILVSSGQEDKIYAFVDNNSSKQGKKFLEKSIISAENLKDEISLNDIVLLTMQEHEKVEKQLVELGITSTIITPVHEYLDIYAEEEIIKNKHKKKHNNFPIRVGFITQEVQSWDKTEPVYKTMEESQKFVTFLFIVPIMDFTKMELTKKSQISTFKNIYQNDRIFLADSDTDLSAYNLDYLFMTAPYDTYYPENLRSDHLVKQMLLCYIPYGYNGAYNFISNNTNRNFFRNIYINFTDTQEIKNQFLRYFKDSIKRNSRKILDIGYPSLEKIDNIKPLETDTGTIMWTPRWSYDSKIGGSHFFEYYYFMCNIINIYPDRKLVFRPHPMMFDNFVRNKIMSQKDVHLCKKQIQDKGIILDEGNDIRTALQNVSVLITDFSTLIMQFFMTGKPIIYCTSENIRLNSDYSRLMSGIYIANDEEGIKNALFQIIENGDPLVTIRKKIIDTFYNKFKGSTQRILDTIEKDFLIYDSF